MNFFKLILTTVLFLGWFAPADVQAELRDAQLERSIVDGYSTSAQTVVIDGKRYLINDETEKGYVKGQPVDEWIEQNEIQLKKGDEVLYSVNPDSTLKLDVIYKVMQ